MATETGSRGRRRDSPRHAGGEIEADGLRVRGQGIEALPAQPGGELPPIGVIGALGVVGAGVAGVIAGFFGERGEMGGGGPLGERRAAALRTSSSMSAISSSFWRPFGACASFRAEKSDASAGLRRVDFGSFSPGTPGLSNHVR